MSENSIFHSDRGKLENSPEAYSYYSEDNFSSLTKIWVERAFSDSLLAITHDFLVLYRLKASPKRSLTMTEIEQEIDPPMVELIKVYKQYPPDIMALTNISLSVDRGEKIFIIGRSGAGKTTLLKLISAMEQPSNGMIEVSGNQIHTMRGSRLAKLRQKIGVAYQDFKLLTDRTVAENIAISMEVSYKKPQIIQNRVRALLEQLDLSDKHDTITGELSRGEQQRITLARAVANSPTMVLVDEPTGNLDADTTRRVVSLLDSSHKSGATVIIATHDESIYRHRPYRIMELQEGSLKSIAGGVSA